MGLKFEGLCLMFPEHAMTSLVSAHMNSGCTPVAFGHLSSRSKELRNSSSSAQLAKARGVLRGMSIMRWSRCMVMAVAAACLAALLGCGDEITYPECSSFSKNGVSPVTDATTCREACVTAEGLAEVSGQLEDFKGSSGAGECSCIQASGGHRTICKDSSYTR